MRPTIPLLVRVIPRSQLVAENPSLKLIRPPPIRSDVKRPTLIEVLQKRKKDAGKRFPPNIRIEPELTKKTFKGIPADVRDGLKAVVRER